MTPIERMARAICREAHLLQVDAIIHGPSIWRDGELDAKVDAYWPKWVPAARDALTALRAYTEPMSRAGYEAASDHAASTGRYAWQGDIEVGFLAMIDKASDETP